MLSWSRDWHIPEVGGTAYIGGRGIFPNGPNVSGMVAQNGSKLPGLLGKEWEVDATGLVMVQAQFTALDSTTQTLYPCRFQLVQTKAGSTAAPAPGGVCYWGSLADQEAFIVTADAPGADDPRAAGVYFYTPAKGDYCWIVTAGEVAANCKATVTNASTIGQPAFVTSTGANVVGKVDGLTTATAITVALLSRYIGRFLETAADATKVKILLDMRGLRSI